MGARIRERPNSPDPPMSRPSSPGVSERPPGCRANAIAETGGDLGARPRGSRSRIPGAATPLCTHGLPVRTYWRQSQTAPSGEIGHCSSRRAGAAWCLDAPPRHSTHKRPIGDDDQPSAGLGRDVLDNPGMALITIDASSWSPRRRRPRRRPTAAPTPSPTTARRSPRPRPGVDSTGADWHLGRRVASRRMSLCAVCCLPPSWWLED